MKEIKPFQAWNGVIDFCKRCKLVWFDDGEFETIRSNSERLNKEMPQGPALRKERKLQWPSRRENVIDYSVDGDEINAYNIHYIADYLIMSPHIEAKKGLQSSPLVTFALCFLMLMVAASTLGSGLEQAVDKYAFGLVDSKLDLLKRAVTYAFLHANWLHYLFNAYFLFQFGSHVEAEIGHKNMLLAFVLCCIGGAVGWQHFQGSEQAALIGSSGGVAGLILIHAIKFPANRIALVYNSGVVSINVWVYVIFFLVFEFLAISFGWFEQFGVAHSAHLAGALVGFLLAILL